MAASPRTPTPSKAAVAPPSGTVRPGWEPYRETCEIPPWTSAQKPVMFRVSVPFQLRTSKSKRYHAGVFLPSLTNRYFATTEGAGEPAICCSIVAALGSVGVFENVVL